MGGGRVRRNERNDTYKEPQEARQLRQWQTTHALGNEDCGIEILMAPQLQEPDTSVVVVLVEDAMAGV